MAKKLKLDQVVPEMKKRLNTYMDGYVTGLQKQLAQNAPFETGRLSSSWRIGQGSPDRDVEPEREAPGDVTIAAYSGEIKFGPIVNNNMSFLIHAFEHCLQAHNHAVAKYVATFRAPSTASSHQALLKCVLSASSTPSNSICGIELINPPTPWGQSGV